LKVGLRNRDGNLTYLPNEVDGRVRDECIHVHSDEEEYAEDTDLIAKAAAGVEITVRLDFPDIILKLPTSEVKTVKFNPKQTVVEFEFN
jgi:hypothetical protein